MGGMERILEPVTDAYFSGDIQILVTRCKIIAGI